MAGLRFVPVRAWQRAAVITVVGTVALIAAPAGVLALWHAASGHDPGRLVKWLVSVVGETGILLIALASARSIRERAGSWQAALGLVRPTWRDLRAGLVWTLLELLARIVVVGVFQAVLGREAVRNASNLHVSGHHTGLAVAIALIAASVLAPVAEETQCRGVLLRAGMARWGFA